MLSGILVAADKLAKGNAYTFTITTPVIGLYPNTSTIQGLLQQYLSGFATILSVTRSSFSPNYVVTLSPQISGYTAEYWMSTMKFTMEQAAADGWLSGLGGEIVVASVTGVPMSTYEEQVSASTDPWYVKLFRGIGETAGTAVSSTTSAFIKPILPIIVIGAGAYLVFKAAEKKATQ